MNAAEVARLSDEEICSLAEEAFVIRSRQDALLCLLGGELDRREGWRANGATSLLAWFQERLGLSVASARTYATVGEHLIDLPHLARSLSAGQVSLDKAKVVAGVAGPEDDKAWTESAESLSLHDLGALVRAQALPSRASDKMDEEKRSLRFNDSLRTIVAQLPPVSYGAVRAVLEERVKKMGSDGETSLDQRLADALVSSVTRSGGSGSARLPLVVAHVPFELWRDPDSALPGELERGGLISADVARRLLCDATVVVALDDAEGHTMYEGRARRFPSETQRREVIRRDRHCVFPGCANVLFTNCHHVDEWSAGGRTDLPNLVLLCAHHHHLIHSKLWSMSGNANIELRFVGPTGQVMTSRPSRLWTQISDPKVLAERRQEAVGGTGSKGMPPGRPGRPGRPDGRAQSPDRGG